MSTHPLPPENPTLHVDENDDAIYSDGRTTMLGRVIRWSIDNHAFVLVGTAVLLVAGTITAVRMPVDVFQ